MCDLPLNEDRAMDCHGKIKALIKDHKSLLILADLKEKLRSVQDQLQKIKICHANRRRQREHR